MAGGVRPGLTHIQLVIGRGGVSDQREVADERIGHGDASERLVAGVLYADGVVDDFTCSVGGAASNRGVLDDVQGGCLLYGNRSIVGVGASLARIGGGHVHDGCARVNLGLRDHVAGGVRPGLTHIQLTIGRSGVSDQCEVADERIGHGDAGERLVAGVLHADGVVDDFTCSVGGAASDRRIFDDIQACGLFHSHRSIVGVGAGLVGVGCGLVEDVAACIDLGLRHHMGASPSPSFAHIQFTIGGSGVGHQSQVTDHWVSHRHTCQHLVTGVLHGDGVADDFTRHVGGTAGDCGIFDNVERWHQLLVAKIHIHEFGEHGSDHNALRVRCGLHPTRLLDFAHHIGVVIRVRWIGIGCDREAVTALCICDGGALASVQHAIGILVQEDGPVGHADFVVCCACNIVDAIGIPRAVAVHVIELHAADFAIDDGRGHELDGCGPFAADVHGGLQRSTAPGGGTQSRSKALRGHSTGRGDHQAVLDFGTAALCGGSGVSEGDGDLAIHRASPPVDVSDVTHTSDVGIDRLKATLHAAAIGKAAVVGCRGARKVAGIAVHIGRGHEQKATGVGVGLVIVVGHIEGVALAVDQRLAVAGFVIKDVGYDFTLEVIRFAVGQDVVVPFCRCALRSIAIGPVLVNLADVGCGQWGSQCCACQLHRAACRRFLACRIRRHRLLAGPALRQACGVVLTAQCIDLTVQRVRCIAAVIIEFILKSTFRGSDFLSHGELQLPTICMGDMC